MYYCKCYFQFIRKFISLNYFQYYLVDIGLECILLLKPIVGEKRSVHEMHQRTSTFFKAIKIFLPVGVK